MEMIDGEWENPCSEPKNSPLICALTSIAFRAGTEHFLRIRVMSCRVVSCPAHNATYHTRHSSTTGEDNGSPGAKYSMQ